MSPRCSRASAGGTGSNPVQTDRSRIGPGRIQRADRGTGLFSAPSDPPLGDNDVARSRPLAVHGHPTRAGQHETNPTGRRPRGTPRRRSVGIDGPVGTHRPHHRTDRSGQHRRPCSTHHRHRRHRVDPRLRPRRGHRHRRGHARPQAQRRTRTGRRQQDRQRRRLVLRRPARRRSHARRHPHHLRTRRRRHHPRTRRAVHPHCRRPHRRRTWLLQARRPPAGHLHRQRGPQPEHPLVHRVGDPRSRHRAHQRRRRRIRRRQRTHAQRRHQLHPRPPLRVLRPTHGL